VSPLAGMHSLYSCTYAPKCFNSYDTYNEWIAHEETTHTPHPEIYFCGEIVDDGYRVEQCNASFRDQYDFAEHLQEKHDMHLASVFELDSHAVGQRTQNFWCWFCKSVVDVPSGDQEVWAMERFTHIEEHFLGRGGPRMMIANWVPIFMVATEEEFR
jgi:hypothetical protein